jgi:hypothetical protein
MARYSIQVRVFEVEDDGSEGQSVEYDDVDYATTDLDFAFRCMDKMLDLANSDMKFWLEADQRWNVTLLRPQEEAEYE